jgi:sulfotransferase family protein
MTLRKRVPAGVRARLLLGRRLYRRGTSRARTLPNAIIIGGQKCGTSSLFSYLTANPSIVGGERKEIHFFDRFYERGPAWYRAQFPTTRQLRQLAESSGLRPVVCEATPDYIANPLIPSRVRGLVPDVKLIALLRDPVERTVSHYHHSVRKRYEPLPLPEALDREPERLEGEWDRILSEPLYQSFAHQHHSYLVRGHYAEQLGWWLSVFPKEQLLVLDAAEFFADPSVTVKRVCDFLGIEDHSLASYPVLGNRGYPNVDDDVQQRLKAYFEPHNARLWNLLGTRFTWGEPRDEAGVDG